MKLAISATVALFVLLGTVSVSGAGAGVSLNSKRIPTMGKNNTAEDCLKIMRCWGCFKGMPNDFDHAAIFFKDVVTKGMSPQDQGAFEVKFLNDPESSIKRFYHFAFDNLGNMDVNESLTDFRMIVTSEISDDNIQDNVEYHDAYDNANRKAYSNAEESYGPLAAVLLENLKGKFDEIPGKDAVAAVTFIKNAVKRDRNPNVQAAAEAKFKEDPAWFIDQAHSATISGQTTLDGCCAYVRENLINETNAANREIIGEKFKNDFPTGLGSSVELFNKVKLFLTTAQQEKLQGLNREDRLFFTNFYATVKGTDLEECTQSLKTHLDKLLKKSGI